MSQVMDEEIKRWTARRKSALVLEIIQGKTTAGNGVGFIYQVHFPSGNGVVFIFQRQDPANVVSSLLDPSSVAGRREKF